MRKILFMLLVASFLIGCDKEESTDNDVYWSNDSIAGEWYRIEDSDSIVAEFKYDHYTWYVYNRTFLQYPDLRYKVYFGEYVIKNNRLHIVSGRYNYAKGDSIYIDKDTLNLQLYGKFFKYIKIKEPQ